MINRHPVIVASLLLGFFAVIGTSLVAYTYEATKERIAENERRLKTMAQGRLGKRSLLGMGGGATAPKKPGLTITPGFKREGGKTVAISRGRGRRTRTGR